jgi:exopolysaccharide production protein ExoQ
MSTRSFAAQGSIEFPQSSFLGHFQTDTVPVYQHVLSWLLLPVLLFLATNGQPSIPSLYNGQMMSQNAVLLRTSQGVRPLVVFYAVSMFLVIVIGIKPIWRAVVRNKLIMAGILFAGLSVIWSESKPMTLRSTIELTMTTLFAFYLSERFTTERLMRLLVFVGTAAAIVSIFLVLVLPTYGLYLRDGGGGSPWQGLFSHKNALGTEMAFLLTPIFFIRCRRILKVAYTVMALFLIVMSQSRGSWFITLCVLAFVGWLWLFRRLRHKESLLLVACTCVIILIVACIGFMYLDPLMRAIGKDPTLTGRTGIYEAVIDSILKHPIRGYGYGAFWLGMNQESWKIALRIHWLQIGYAENGFLELGLQLGLIGILLALAAFARAIKQAAQLLHSQWYSPRVGWFATILLLELVTNVEGGVVLTAVTMNWTLTLIAFVGLANEMRARKREIAQDAFQRAQLVVEDSLYA